MRWLFAFKLAWCSSTDRRKRVSKGTSSLSAITNVTFKISQANQILTAIQSPSLMLTKLLKWLCGRSLTLHNRKTFVLCLANAHFIVFCPPSFYLYVPWEELSRKSNSADTKPQRIGGFCHIVEIPGGKLRDRERDRERGSGARRLLQPEGLPFLKCVANKDEIAMQLKQTSNTPSLMRTNIFGDVSPPNYDRVERKGRTWLDCRSVERIPPPLRSSPL